MKQNNVIKSRGFTLIEIMVTVLIFAIISTISYKIVSSLVMTNQIVDETQDKWGSLSLVSGNLAKSVHRLIPLVVRSNNGEVLPALYGKEGVNGLYDGQLQMTLSGVIGDDVTGIKPPKRVEYRFYKNTLYLVTWPVLNRSASTVPQIDVLMENVKSFEPGFLYPDGQWRNNWPPEGMAIDTMPKAMRVTLEMMSTESIVREWILDK